MDISRKARAGVVIVVAAAVIGVATAACGGGKSSSDKTATAAAGPKPAASVAASASPVAGATTAGGSAGVRSLDAMDFKFSLAEIGGTKGQPLTINISNAGPSVHTFTVYKDEEHTQQVSGGDSGNIAPNTKKTITIAATDTTDDLYYRCEIHPATMTGEIKFE